MKQCQIIQEFEQDQLKPSIPEFRVGDTLNVHTRIIEGEKERLQMFSGTVIARRGSGLSETVALYRVSYGAGMERVFMLHSPKIAKIEVAKQGKVRKSKLYYIRGKSGRGSKIEENLHGNRASKKAAVHSEVDAVPAT